MATIPEALAIAVQHHQGGRLHAAEQVYRQILEVDPNQVDAVHLLGVIAHQVGKHEVAVECIGRAIGLRGNVAAFHNNLGGAYALHRVPEAVACFRRAVELKPDYAEAHNNLGIACNEQGKLDAAIACYRRAVELKPDYAEAHSNLGVAFAAQGKLDEAIACYRRAAGAEAGLCRGARQLGQWPSWPGKAGRSGRLLPPGAGTEAGLCRGTQQPGQCLEGPGEAGRSDRLLSPGTGTEAGLMPRRTTTWAMAFKDQGKLDEAVACYRRALELKPDFAEAHNNLGNALKDQGKLDEAVACYRRALELKPDYAVGAQQPAPHTPVLRGHDAGNVGRGPCRVRSPARGAAAAFPAAG